MASALMLSLVVGGVGATWYLYKRIDNYHGWNPTLIKVRKHVRNLVDQPRVALERNLGMNGDPGGDSPLPAFYLEINSKNLDGFLASLPKNKNVKIRDAREYWKGKITPVGFEGIPEEKVSVKFRCRGNGSAHWFWPKKSWRIKFGKEELFRGIRKLNLINPESISMLNDAIANCVTQV